MKKLSCLFLALAMLLSLCACAGSKEPTPMSKDELLTDAENTDIGKVVDSEDIGKSYKIGGYIFEMADSYCVISDGFGYEEIKVYLSNEDLEVIDSLPANSYFYVVGVISSVEEEDIGSGLKKTVIELADGYYIDNVYELTGEILNFGTTSGNAYDISYCVIGKGTSPIANVFLDKEILKTLEEGDTITVRGTLVLNEVFGGAKGVMKEAELVE